MRQLKENLKKIMCSFIRDEQPDQAIVFFCGEQTPFLIEKLQLINGEDEDITLSITPDDSDRINAFLLASFNSNKLISNIKPCTIEGADGSSLRMHYSNYGDPFQESVAFDFQANNTNFPTFRAEASPYELHQKYIKSLQEEMGV
jgi:hypothetical protein